MKNIEPERVVDSVIRYIAQFDALHLRHVGNYSLAESNREIALLMYEFRGHMSALLPENIGELPEPKKE
jgi:hypothetical protein